MNEHLTIPKEIKNTIAEIMNVDLNFGELPMAEHPMLPQFNRTIRVLNIEAKSAQQLIIFLYEQVLRNKETGEEINITLPSPEWIVLKDNWSYLRGSDNKPIEAPAVDGKIMQKVKVPSYRYIIWLMKNNKAGFIQLIEGYLSSFVDSKIEDLNKL